MHIIWKVHTVARITLRHTHHTDYIINVGDSTSIALTRTNVNYMYICSCVYIYIHIDDIIYYDTESHSILRGLLPKILRKFGYAERLCTDRTIFARTMATYLTICGHFPSHY